ncbi:MAG: alpha-glucosidase C-terminal domain-containing protein [Chthonomonas sp.]|nr:alpha-glucosidase C-terminal domain-containing protein [Chthonomonas sp.]
MAGTFNGWNKDANPMTKSGMQWRTTLRMPVGKHYYKFVINGDTWITDPLAKVNEDDGSGYVNSRLVILPPSYSKPGVKGDGTITTEVVSHDQALPSLNYDQGKVRLTLKGRSNDVEKVAAVVGGKAFPMTVATADDIFTTYEVKIPWDRKSELKYQFRMTDGPKVVTLAKDGFGGTVPFLISPKTFTPFMVPSWVEKTVFYQIFPDRFENGSKANDPKDTEDWKKGVPTYSNWFGGDAEGIRQRIPYLQGLGVNSIYINPVMLGNSNHRYDPCDFYKIDPPFGTNDEFINLTRELKKAGIKTVLDQIFDHVGIKFPQFLDLLKNQEKSKYKDWFFVKSWPVEVRPNPPYEGWWGTEYMPKVNMNNPEVREYMFSSIAFWMSRAELAGWRMDVANEVPMEFWREFRKYVKKIDKDAYLVGEVWYNAAPWLGGDQWDASMNYPFRDQAVRFIAQSNISASQFANGLMQVYHFTAPQVARNQLNLLSSHDTERFIHLAGGNRQLQMLGATLQMTWVGAPSIYYGEELGMPGGKDPDNRRPMMWDEAKPSNEIYSHYRKLIALRTRSAVLASGEPVILSADDAKKSMAYARVLGNEAIVTVLNRSDQPQTLDISLSKLPEAARRAMGASPREFFTGNSVSIQSANKLRVTVPPLSAALVGTPGSGLESKQSVPPHRGGE